MKTLNNLRQIFHKTKDNRLIAILPSKVYTKFIELSPRTKWIAFEVKLNPYLMGNTKTAIKKELKRK